MTVALGRPSARQRCDRLRRFGHRTYGELNAREPGRPGAARQGGIRAGDGVVIMFANRPEFVEVYAACMRRAFVRRPSTGT